MPNDISAVLRALLGGGRGDVDLSPPPRKHDIELPDPNPISREAREHWKRQDEDIERRRREDRSPFFQGMPRNRK
jgi:hypothetical protein